MHTQSTSVFISRSMLVRLNLVRPLFCISFVSGPGEQEGIRGCLSLPCVQHSSSCCLSPPAKMTRPKHHSVLRRTQPRSSMFWLLRGYLFSFQYSVPPNLSSLLLGGSQITSPGCTVWLSWDLPSP